MCLLGEGVSSRVHAPASAFPDPPVSSPVPRDQVAVKMPKIRTVESCIMQAFLFSLSPSCSKAWMGPDFWVWSI